MKTFIITLTLIAGLAADAARQSISTSTTTTTTADGTKVVVVTEKDGKVETRTFQRPAPPGMPPRALPAGKFKMPYLGIALAEASEDLSRHLGLPDGVGVLVAQVLKDSPAAKSGLKDHDLLTRIDEQILFNVEQVVSLIRSLKAGQEIKLTFHRLGEERSVKVMLAEKEIGVLNQSVGSPRVVPLRIEQNRKSRDRAVDEARDHTRKAVEQSLKDAAVPEAERRRILEELERALGAGL